MSICCSVSESCSTKSSASTTDLSEYSAMFSPPTVTASDSLRSRLPPHAGQGHSDMHSSSSLRTPSLCVSR